MSAFGHPTMRQATYAYPEEQQQDKPEVTILPTVVETGSLVHTEDQVRIKYYTPLELRTPVLVAFVIFTLAIFTLLQLAAAAFVGAPSLHALIGRSVDSASDCPVGATCVPAPGSWTNPNASPSPSIPTTGAPAPGSWTTATGWTKADYFVVAYLPTLAAVLFSIGWKCIFARLKEMEPFYQMMRPGGARAKDSLLLSYSGANIAKVLLSSFGSSHWLSFLGAATMGLVTICTLLASETLFFSSKGEACYVIVDPTSDSNDHCQLQLNMRPVLAWVLGVILFAVIASTIVATVLLRRQASGIFAETTSIVGIACLYSGKLSQEPAQALQDPSRRYTLVPSNSNGINSIVDLQPTSSPAPQYHEAQTATSRKKQYYHASMHPAAITIFWLFLVAVLVLVLYYRFVSKPGTGNALEEFMDSQSFGVRLFMTVLGLLVKFYWGWVEQYIRSTGPYTALASPQGATAEQSVLMRVPSHPVTALFYMETWRHVLLGAVTVMAVLSEVLVITLNAIPFSTATTYLAFELSTYISIGILAAMTVTVPAVLVWKVTIQSRREFHDLPECIGDLFRLLGDVTSWSAVSMLGRRERDQTVRSWQVRFALRKVQGSESTNAGWRIVILRRGESVA